jgi:gamma-glutamyltranspeptidase/glutathione hydrolase
MKRPYSFGLMCLSFCLVAQSTPLWAASSQPVGGTHGMVVTAQHLATEIGVDVLKRGGTAIDAAVAVGYALAVVYPAAGNLGGGGFMNIRFADGRETFVDFREKAPGAARADMYLNAAGDVIPGLSTRGYLAVGVPGSVAGLEYIRAKYGTKPRAELIAPSIKLAAHGFVLDQGDVDLLANGTTDFVADDASASIFLNKGRAFRAGERLVQKELAASLRAISERGPDAFYKGMIAKKLVAGMKAHGGLITMEDLAAYNVREFEPVHCDYRGYRISSSPPPSSGGVVICESLNILETFPLADLGFHSAQSVHYLIEALRHAYADRNNYLGDPDYVKNPVAQLTDKQFAAAIAKSIDPAKANLAVAASAVDVSHEGSNTTHYEMIDSAGNAVAVTYTLNDWFGARVTAPGTGILLNDEMDDFTSKPGVPNMYGLVQGAANAIAPGKRPLSAMTPTIITKDGKPVMLIGTPGGSRIPTGVLQAILNVIDHGMTIQEAIDAPKIHQQWRPVTTGVERFALSPDTRRLLEAMGHQFTEGVPASHLEGILVGAPSLGGQRRGDAIYYGANDTRRSTGSAMGY